VPTDTTIAIGRIREREEGISFGYPKEDAFRSRGVRRKLREIKSDPLVGQPGSKASTKDEREVSVLKHQSPL
jgi:hypothetical protein